MSGNWKNRYRDHRLVYFKPGPPQTIGIVLGNVGLYGDNGKEHGNYYIYIYICTPQTICKELAFEGAKVSQGPFLGGCNDGLAGGCVLSALYCGFLHVAAMQPLN